VLAAFGGIAWSYYEAEAAAALRTIAAACATAGNELVVDVGGSARTGDLPGDLAALGATILQPGDQWAALADADLFLTHHGLNSTHEAIYHRTPMLSYPLFGDQVPAAARCAALGLAVPLVAEPRSRLTEADVLAGMDAVAARADEMAEALQTARDWELRTIADRPRVAATVVDLAR
jgi:UDP:flavonoid glycosyltransferase YjiC (YdhE family)